MSPATDALREAEFSRLRANQRAALAVIAGNY